MTKKMITAVFRDRVNAQSAFDWLQYHGYTSSEINVMMSDQTRKTFEKSDREDHIYSGNLMTEGVATGGAIGTAVGATIAGVLAAGVTVAIPGVGIVAGPIVAALAGGGAGAVAGGLIGGLIGLGISESNAKAYEHALRSGGVAIGVVPHNDDDADEIRKRFAELEGENIVTV